MIRDFQGRLRRRAQRAGATLTPDAAARFETYYTLLARWNARINLTALNLNSGEEAIDRLLIEPLLASRVVRKADSTLVDIGSGGGSPALPLAIAAPHLRLTMVEVKVRKSAFLREAIRALELDARVLTSRFEQLLADPAMHESFDLLSLRAVRIDERILSGIQSFVKPAGRFLLFRPTGNQGDLEHPPTLVVKKKLPLVENLRSQLVVMEKRPIGRAGSGVVPRGTEPEGQAS